MTHRAKTLLMWSIMLAIPVVAAVGLVEARYAWGYLSYEGYYCEPFAVLDGEIGWTLKPRAESCIGAGEAFGDKVYFEAPVYTDDNGFRSAAPGGATPQGAILAIGDSWTFGYGVAHEVSYPGQLDAMVEQDVVTVASPAYAGSQAVQLAKRWAPKLEPRALVYLELGFWERGACSGAAQPAFILKPCFWSGGDGKAELVLPPEGLVAKMGALGLRPGGMLGAGELTPGYFMWSRPLAKISQMLVRVGLTSGMADDFRAVGVDGLALRQALLAELAQTASAAKAPLVLVDPNDLYAGLVENLATPLQPWVTLVGSARWAIDVAKPAAALSEAEARVPNDGHFGPGMNKLVAALVRDLLLEVGVR